MVKRCVALSGMAVAMVAIAAALLAGAAVAAADTGAEPAARDTTTSASTQQSDSTTDPDETTTGKAATPKPTPGSDDGDTGETETAAHVDPPAADSLEHDEGSDAQVPNSGPDPADKPRHRSKTGTSGSDEPGISQPVGDTTVTTASTSAASSPSSDPEPPPAAQPTTSASDAAVRNQQAIDTDNASSTTTTMPSHTTAAVTEQAAPPRTPTLGDVVGSVVLNLVMGLIHVIDGPPVLPPGSTVTVRTSNLTIGSKTVDADWYFPAGADPTRLIYLQHGMLASGPMYSYTAAALAEQTHSIVVAPSLTSNWFAPDRMWVGGQPMQHAVADLFVGDRTALAESASAAAGYDVLLPNRFVLTGHSLGGSLVMGAAGNMVDNGAIDDLAGVLLLDSVDFGNSVPTALDRLTGANDRPVLNISSERYVWNRDGVVNDELEAARPGRFNGVMLVGGRHIDALLGGNPLVQFGEYLIAGFSQSENIEAAKILAVGWVNDMFAGTHDGIYGAAQQAIDIPTAAGTATAVVLPSTSAESIQATPFDWLFRILLSFISEDSFAAAERPHTSAGGLVALRQASGFSSR